MKMWMHCQSPIISNCAYVCMYMQCTLSECGWGSQVCRISVSFSLNPSMSHVLTEKQTETTKWIKHLI